MYLGLTRGLLGLYLPKLCFFNHSNLDTKHRYKLHFSNDNQLFFAVNNLIGDFFFEHYDISKSKC